jgi:hypothetical protein
MPRTGRTVGELMRAGALQPVIGLLAHEPGVPLGRGFGVAAEAWIRREFPDADARTISDIISRAGRSIDVARGMQGMDGAPYVDRRTIPMHDPSLQTGLSQPGRYSYRVDVTIGSAQGRPRLTTVFVYDNECCDAERVRQSAIDLARQRFAPAGRATYYQPITMSDSPDALIIGVTRSY